MCHLQREHAPCDPYPAGLHRPYHRRNSQYDIAHSEWVIIIEFLKSKLIKRKFYVTIMLFLNMFPHSPGNNVIAHSDALLPNATSFFIFLSFFFPEGWQQNGTLYITVRSAGEKLIKTTSENSSKVCAR